MKKKQILAVVLACMLLLSLAGCGNNKTDLNIEAGASEIVDAFAQSDINLINAVIFNTRTLNVDEELSDYFSDIQSDVQEESGILTQIFAVDTITVKKINETSNEITYEVKAPDLSGTFSNLSDVTNLTEADFEQYLLDYIQSADTVTTSVSVSYTYDGEVFFANYKTAEFVNAITGGLLDAYRSLYQEMVNEYFQEMEDAK